MKFVSDTIQIGLCPTRPLKLSWRCCLFKVLAGAKIALQRRYLCFGAVLHGYADE